MLLKLAKFTTLEEDFKNLLKITRNKDGKAFSIRLSEIENILNEDGGIHKRFDNFGEFLTTFQAQITELQTFCSTLHDMSEGHRVRSVKLARIVYDYIGAQHFGSINEFLNLGGEKSEIGEEGVGKSHSENSDENSINRDPSETDSPPSEFKLKLYDKLPFQIKSGSERDMESSNAVEGSSPSPDSKIHYLKTLPEHYQPHVERKKMFEARFDDRDFKVGDYLVLEEWDGEKYTGRKNTAEVTYILRAEGSSFSFLGKYVIMGIRF